MKVHESVYDAVRDQVTGWTVGLSLSKIDAQVWNARFSTHDPVALSVWAGKVEVADPHNPTGTRTKMT